MEKITLSAKITRLRARFSDPEWRRFGALLLTGELTGIGLLLLGWRLHESGPAGLAHFRGRPGAEGQRHRQSDQYGVDAGCGVPGVSACRLASPCSKRASAARAKRSTC